MTNQQKIIKTKVGILELARQLGNVSQACKVTLSGKRCTTVLMRYSLTWMNGCGSITMSGRTAANTAMGKRRCRHSPIQFR